MKVVEIFGLIASSPQDVRSIAANYLLDEGNDATSEALRNFDINDQEDKDIMGSFFLGNGSGYGNGDRHGSGYGDGNLSGSGYGDGYGDGLTEHEHTGYGAGDGRGTGFGELDYYFEEDDFI